VTAAHTPRVLLAVTFYNGRSFAERTLSSIASLAHDGFDLDVLVLDDASPEPGFSDYLASLSADVGATYYRSPRNLGIPRNVNLGLATALRLEYDYVVISNSDVIYAANSLEVMMKVAVAGDDLASVTAWSTNVDPYSLPNATELFAETQEVSDRIGRVLEQTFGTETLDIPAGISFAIIIPTRVLSAVGLMDPIFGRGYGEESDWSARATSAGFRHVLATGAFVYHAGRGSTLAAGVVSGDEIANWANQRIVNHRSPMFRWNVDGFLASGAVEVAQSRAVTALVRSAADESGYSLITAARDWVDQSPEIVSVAIRSEVSEICTAHWYGFVAEIDTVSADVEGDIRRYFGGRNPVYSNIRPPVWDVAGAAYPRSI
jgi:GT2 family glycosyltransferase